MKALFAVGISVDVDPSMISNFLLTDLVVNPENESQTFYMGIQKLPKSCSLKVGISGVALQDKWMEQEDNMNLINLAVETLIKSGWLNKDVQLPTKFHWKILMLFSLLKFSKTDFGKC
ncbi:MAG: hypothetical protein IPM74_09540 [Crocinitomicaceae bacterium]|nr:hypothetical protein [Crocinitomicaceae bacterium]MBK8926134.1 hypothetical protein [Crocinitomicaceae bacterium]